MPKDLFVAASYSSKVDYETGEVFPEYKEWLENILNNLEAEGYSIFCALRADQYKINNSDPASAYKLDKKRIKGARALLALVDAETSSGVQTEIGLAVAYEKPVVIAHDPLVELSWFNKAMIKAGDASESLLPLDYKNLPLG